MATITKRNGTYRIRVSSGYDSSGKQIMHSMTWKPEPGMTAKQIEKELERQKVLFEEKVRNGQFISGDIKFSDFAAQWLTTYGKEHLKPSTYKSYAEQLQRINAAIGHISLNNLQPHHIISFYDNLKEKGIRCDLKYSIRTDLKKLLKQKGITQQVLAQMSGLSVNTIRVCGNGDNIAAHSAQAISTALNTPLLTLFKQQEKKESLSGTTLLYHHRVLSSILSTAVHWQIIASNPCARVKPPKSDKKEARYLDEEQAQEVISCLNAEPLQFKALITLLLYSGMRRGEVCGLTWNDINFDSCLIDINKANLYLPGKGVFETDTKNTSSHRVIKLPMPTIDLLKQYRAEQNAERLRLGDKWIKSDKVFTQWNGEAIHPDTVTRKFHKFIEKYDLPKITVHSLRHTNATLMIANGADIKTVSKRLGHANVTTTGNIYTHAIKAADEMAADILQSLFMKDKAKKA